MSKPALGEYGSAEGRVQQAEVGKFDRPTEAVEDGELCEHGPEDAFAAEPEENRESEQHQPGIIAEPLASFRFGSGGEDEAGEREENRHEREGLEERPRVVHFTEIFEPAGAQADRTRHEVPQRQQHVEELDAIAVGTGSGARRAFDRLQDQQWRGDSDSHDDGGNRLRRFAPAEAAAEQVNAERGHVEHHCINPHL